MHALALVGLVLVIGLLLWGFSVVVLPWVAQLREEAKTAPPSVPPPSKVRLKTIGGTCETCAEWDFEHGQRTMARSRAFFAASEHVPPSQMAVPMRAFKPNPRYEEVRAELDKALDEGAPDARLRELQAELELLNPQIVDEEAVKVDTRVARLEWGDFGACMVHRELRAKTDRCDEYTGKGE